MPRNRNKFMSDRWQPKRFIGAFLLMVMIAGQPMAQGSSRDVIGILIDNTGSMRPHLSLMKEIAKEIVASSSSTTYFSLFSFQFVKVEKKERAMILLGSQCSTDREILKKEIDILPIQPGQTMLYDTIRDAADLLAAKRPPTCDAFTEKTFVIISDGEDRASTLKDKELISELQAKKVKVYAVGLIGELSDEPGFVSKSSRDKGKDFLKKLTRETGGNVVFPKNKQSVPDILKALFEPRAAANK